MTSPDEATLIAFSQKVGNTGLQLFSNVHRQAGITNGDQDYSASLFFDTVGGISANSFDARDWTKILGASFAQLAASSRRTMYVKMTVAGAAGTAVALAISVF